MFGPDEEEFAQQLCDLRSQRVLVHARAEVGFRGSQGGGEIQGFESGRFRGFGEVGGVENFEEGRGEGNVGG